MRRHSERFWGWFDGILYGLLAVWVAALGASLLGFPLTSFWHQF